MHHNAAARRGTARRRAVVTVAAALVVTSALLWPSPARPGSVTIAVFSPWMSKDALFRAAAQNGVHVLGTGAVPGVMLVSADSAAALVSLYGAGAWSLMSSDGLAGCFDLPGGAAVQHGSGA